MENTRLQGEIFDRIEGDIKTYSPISLANYLGVSQKNIVPASKDALLYFEMEKNPANSPLHGSIFLVDERRVIRGFPKIGYVGIYRGDDRELDTEIAITQNPPVYFEEKKNGVNIRAFKHNKEVGFATRYSYERDGKWTEIAEELFGESEGLRVLVDQGYVPVFEMTHPDFEEFTGARNEKGVYLIDLIKDHRFIGVDERRSISERYGFVSPRIFEVLDGELTVEKVREECRRVNELCAREGIEGAVIRDSQGSIALKTKPRRERYGLKDATNMILDRYLREQGAKIFLEGSALSLVISEIEEDFVLKNTNRKVVMDRYDHFERRVQDVESNRELAEEILSKGNFLDSRELAKFIKEQGISGILKGVLFEEYKKRRLIVPDTNFFYSFSVRSHLAKGGEVSNEDRSYIPRLEGLLNRLYGDYRLIPMVSQEFSYPAGGKSPEEVLGELNVRRANSPQVSCDLLDEVFTDIQKARLQRAIERNHVLPKEGSKRLERKKKKDFNDARVIAEYELVRDSDQRRKNYVLVSAEESVVDTVKLRGGIFLRF
jgi:hypothetical protein